jgi:hypothetical protein
MGADEGIRPGAVPVVKPLGPPRDDCVNVTPRVLALSCSATVSPGKGARQPVQYQCHPCNSPAERRLMASSFRAVSSGVHVTPPPFRGWRDRSVRGFAGLQRFRIGLRSLRPVRREPHHPGSKLPRAFRPRFQAMPVQDGIQPVPAGRRSANPIVVSAHSNGRQQLPQLQPSV